MARVLEENMCPPSEIPHLIDDYPYYYDPLYFPHLYPSLFVNSRNFCDWLASALNDHHVSCCRCNSYMNVSVIYDGMIITITCNARSVTMSLQVFENAGYHHCMVFSKIDQNNPLNVSDYLSIKISDFPSWFHYSSELVNQQLMHVSLQTLSQSARGVGIQGEVLRSKKLCVDALRSHIFDTKHDLFVRSTSPFMLLDKLKCDNHQLYSSESLLSLLCSYFDCLYGTSVAVCLRFSPVVVWSFDISKLIIDSGFSWLNCSVSTLTRHLHGFTKSMITNIIQSLPLFIHRPSIERSRTKTAQGLVSHVIYRTHFLLSAGANIISDIYLSYFPSEIPTFSHSDGHYISLILEHEYSKQFCMALSNNASKSDKHKFMRHEKKINAAINAQQLSLHLRSNWPTVVPNQTIFSCLTQYYEGSVWKMPLTCAVCSQQLLDVQSFIVMTNSPLLQRLQCLSVNDPFIKCKCTVQCMSSTFQYDCPLINNLMLDKIGLTDINNDSVKMNFCSNCYRTLTNIKTNKIPRFALANNLYRGDLPDNFSDLTWVEEKVCAKYCVTAHVTRLFHSNDPSQPHVFHGNTCAHDMNIVSTASVLPRTPSDVNGFIGVVFLGPRPVKSNDLGSIFRVRRKKIWAFLVWLVNHNKLYADIVLNKEFLALYPVDGPLPGMLERVVHDDELDVNKVFHEETAGFQSHPATLLHESNAMSSSVDENGVVMIEKMGVSDPECNKFSGRSFIASAIRNLYTSSSQNKPDLVIHRGSQAINEYNNPDLIPGCFPMLFPFGIGGFEMKDRPVSLSFQQQAAYYLNLHDRSFRYHNTFIFVCLNIIQRRQAHLYTYFTVKKSYFSKVVHNLISVSPEILNSLATRLENECSLSNLSVEEKNATNLLKYVNTIAARIPGSHASKILVRNEIRNYFGYFGLPQLFFTFNPNPAHSPIFQVMYGDLSVDLTSRFPKLVSARERALRLAHDPVAAADFYRFSFECCFQYLLGWDFKKGKSTKEGGIFGHLRAFYGSSEYTERGNLHGHFLLWLDGGLNPADVHRHLSVDVEYQKQFFSFFDDIIWHHLPDIEMKVDKKFEPRMERPPYPPNYDAALDIIEEWESIFVTEVKKCGEILQRHVCAPVCHKYGNDSRCRFLFPHEIVEASHFDSDTNSVILMCRDGTINNFNPYILVFCRHNHDLKCILSGKAAKAAMFYISDYITKMDTKTYEMLSLLSRAVARITIPNPMLPNAAINSAKNLLHKCLSQFSRQQQIHAQQAAYYIRGFGDGIPSHKTVPMMSLLLLLYVEKSIKSQHYNESFEDSDCEDEDSIEQPHIRLVMNKNGEVVNTNQIDHYIYRADSLLHLCFYDFVRKVRIETKAKDKRTKNTHESRLGVLKRHNLKEEHPLSNTHILIEHTNELCGDGTNEYVPRIVGTSIPRKSNTDAWALFALAHFKPFNANQPLLQQNDCIKTVFEHYNFSDKAQEILLNWEAIHECEDERDAERL